MLEKRRLAIITGMWANDGLNGKENERTNALAELEDQFNTAVERVYTGDTEEAENRLTEEDEKNPFLRPAIEATRAIDTPRDDEGTVKQAIDSEGYEIDQDD